MITLVGSVLVASLIGSLHCVGMCGGFVAFVAGNQGRGSALRQQGVYHCGRLLTYVLLGIISGTLGYAIDLAGSAMAMQQVAAVLAGAVMLTWGIVQLLVALGAPLSLLAKRGRPGKWVARIIARLRGKPPLVRAFVVGLMTTLLPCGWLYAYVVVAAGTASPWTGAAVMIAFWLGTVPALLGFGLALRRIAGWLGRSLPALTASVLIVIGLVTLFTRTPVHQQVKSPQTAACCDGHR